MKLNRIAAASVSALVVLGGAGVASAQSVPDPTTTIPDPTTTVPDPTTTVPAPVADTFSFTIVGLGDLTVSVDPTTGDISNVVVAPIDGVTVGSPVTVHNGVQLDFTLADGTVSTVIIRTESHHAKLELEIILPDGRKVELHGTTPVTIDPANPPTDDEHEGENRGQHEGADESEHSGDHVVTAPNTPGTERSGEVRRDGEHRPTTTTAAPTAQPSTSGSRSGSSGTSGSDRQSERERD